MGKPGKAELVPVPESRLDKPYPVFPLSEGADKEMILMEECHLGQNLHSRNRLQNASVEYL
jgi:hypothetical protein